MKRTKKLNKTIKFHKKTHSNERYLITYADLLTLLFALFILLYAMSRPDMEKMQEFLRAMNNVFSPNQIIEGNNLTPNVTSEETPPVILFPSQPLNISDVQNEVESALSALIESNTIIFQPIPEGVKLLIPNKFLFPSAKASLLPQSNKMLDSIASAIGKLDMQIQIDGHTDAIPIRTFTYSSNWELSAARSVTVVQELIQKGVAANNLVVRAFGEQRPIADNLTEEGREQNRRVEIIITPKDVSAATTDTENVIKNDTAN